jgi:hypothetical protein
MEASLVLNNNLTSPLKETSFFKVWKNDFPNVKTTKFIRMGCCDTCLLLQHSLKTCETVEKKKNFINQKNMHNLLHTHARSFLTSKRLQSEQTPWEVMHICFDGKQAARIPHITPLPKDTQCIPRLKLDCFGVINWGEKAKQYYLMLPHWEHGPNVSITILYYHILEQFTKMKHSRPHTLVIQIDNCAREGKNKYILAFASHLVCGKL